MTAIGSTARASQSSSSLRPRRCMSSTAGAGMPRGLISSGSPRRSPSPGSVVPGSRRARRGLVSPPVALTVHVVARILAEVGRTEEEDLQALRPALVASPRAGWDAHHVPLLDRDDLVVELHPPAPAHDHVDLLLLLVRVAEREAIVGRYALVAQAALLELKRLACVAKLKVRRAVEVGPEILQILLEAPERERHGRDPTIRLRPAGPTESLGDASGRSPVIPGAQVEPPIEDELEELVLAAEDVADRAIAEDAADRC